MTAKTVKLLFFYFTILLCVQYCHSLSENEQCLKLSPCKCEYKDGTGVDLSLLYSKSSFFISTVPQNNLTFYFHPCSDSDVINATSGCKDVSMCLFNATSGNYTSLGKSDEATFRPLSNKIKKNYYTYTHEKTITNIELACSDSDLSVLYYEQGPSDKEYNLVLFSQYACVHNFETSSLSTGSVLVILLLVFSSIYFFGGALILRLLRGARGREMIPNYDFWCDLPSLVRDGVVFLQNGCVAHAAQSTYDQI